MPPKQPTNEELLAEFLATPETPENIALYKLLDSEGDDEVDYDIGRSIDNLGSSGLNYASDIADGLLGLSPVTLNEDSGIPEFRFPPTIETAGRAALGGLDIAAQNLTGRRDEALAMREQGVQPSQNEMLAEGIGQYYTDRYGGTDNIKTTLMEDPVAAIADAAGVVSLPLSIASKVTKIGGLSKTSAAMEQAARIAAGFDPATYLTHPLKGLDELTGVTRKMYQEGMRLGDRANDRVDARNAAELGLDNRIFPTENGLVRSRELLNDQNAVLARALEDTPDIEVARIYDEVAGLETDLPTGRGGPRGSATPAADAEVIANTADTHYASVGPRYPDGTMPASHANDIKTALQKGVRDSYAQEGVITPSADTQKTMARGTRVALEEANPALADINREVGARGLLAKTVEDQLNAPPDIRPRMDYPTRNLTGSAALSLAVGKAYEAMAAAGIWGRQLMTNQPQWVAVRQLLVAEGKSVREAEDWLTEYNRIYGEGNEAPAP